MLQSLLATTEDWPNYLVQQVMWHTTDNLNHHKFGSYKWGKMSQYAIAIYALCSRAGYVSGLVYFGCIRAWIDDDPVGVTDCKQYCILYWCCDVLLGAVHVLWLRITYNLILLMNMNLNKSPLNCYQNSYHFCCANTCMECIRESKVNCQTSPKLSVD